MSENTMMNSLQPILEKGDNKKVFDSIRADWVTNIWYEKVGLMFCILWTFVSIGYLIWRFLL